MAGKLVFTDRTDAEKECIIEWQNEHDERRDIRLALTQYLPKNYRLLTAEGEGKLVNYFQNELKKRGQLHEKYSPDRARLIWLLGTV